MTIIYARNIVYIILALFTLFIIINILRRNKPSSSIRINNLFSNPFFLDIAPSAFTTIGVFGTFLGIFFGLKGFDVNNISDSIPHLLDGMKTAFATSLWGIGLSFVFAKIIAFGERKDEQSGKKTMESELSALKEIHKVIGELNSSIISDNDHSISTHLIKTRSLIKDSSDDEKVMLNTIAAALGGDGETSLLTQIQKLRLEQKESVETNKKNIELIIAAMHENNLLLQGKFDEFSELLAKNNTEALVEVMKSATEEFNNQMSSLIDKLVQENFKELNTSVERLNTWQLENKEQIAVLTNQFTKVSQDFAVTSESIKEITTNTSLLTNDNSLLKKLVEELNKVLIEDSKFEDITNKLDTTVNTLKENTEAFDETSNKLNNWVRNQKDFSDSVASLLTRLEEIDKIKDINDVFWNNTRKQLNEGVNIIENASNKLANDIEGINAEFYERLNDTLQNLDNLIQRIILNYK